MLEVLKTLQAGDFSRALANCVFKARIIPDIVRSDRGPEMTSRVNREFLALCQVRQIFGASLTPRHQGLGERGHQVVMTNQMILMKEICRAFPQEWSSLIPAVECLMHTAPQGPHGLSAHDLGCAYSIANPSDLSLIHI